jgi:hypothetical protein
MASRTPFTLEFPEEEHGITGRWSDIKSAVIP